MCLSYSSPSLWAANKHLEFRFDSVVILPFKRAGGSRKRKNRRLERRTPRGQRIAAAEELDDGTRTFNYGPPSQKSPISISQEGIWRSSMTSASVALHESNLSLRADTFVLRRTCVHHGKVTRRRKPDEWWINPTLAQQKKGLAASGGADGGLPAMPAVSPGRCRRPPSPLVPPHLRWQKRNHPQADGATYFGWPTQTLCPCHMSLTLVFWLKRFETGLLSLGLRPGGNEGGQKRSRRNRRRRKRRRKRGTGV